QRRVDVPPRLHARRDRGPRPLRLRRDQILRRHPQRQCRLRHLRRYPEILPQRLYVPLGRQCRKRRDWRLAAFLRLVVPPLRHHQRRLRRLATFLRHELAQRLGRPRGRRRDRTSLRRQLHSRRRHRCPQLDDEYLLRRLRRRILRTTPAPRLRHR